MQHSRKFETVHKPDSCLPQDLWIRPAAVEAIIFADDPSPWDSNALEDTVTSLGITYTVYTSDQMATVDLPLNKIVWIINDQPQAFYNNYYSNQSKFDNFVNAGGTLLFEACDKGWNGGSLADAGATLPGNVTSTMVYDYNNTNINPTHPMMTGVPTALYGTYASHNYYLNLPVDSTILCVDSQNHPTLVEYKCGMGRVIATGQPLEYNVNNNQNLKQIYPNMVKYTFNMPIDEPTPSPSPAIAAKRPARLSSGK